MTHLQAFVDRLGAAGITTYPAFLSPSLLRDARADLEALRSEGGFAPAGTGQNRSHVARNANRTDETYWLEREHSTPTRAKLWRKVDRLRQHINRTLFLGLRDFEGHYAIYPQGGFYRRHLDSLSANHNPRIVSFVLYLNRDWQSADGGQLRVYEGTDGVYQDIDPVGGDLVCFLSREKEHEVLTSFAERLSLSGWFRAG